jgi:hypothetical protein
MMASKEKSPKEEDNPWDREDAYDLYEAPASGDDDSCAGAIARFVSHPQCRFRTAVICVGCVFFSPCSGCCCLYHYCSKKKSALEQAEDAAYESDRQQSVTAREQRALEREETMQHIRDWTATPASQVYKAVTFRSSTTGNKLTFTVDARKRMHLSR